MGNQVNGLESKGIRVIFNNLLNGLDGDFYALAGKLQKYNPRAASGSIWTGEYMMGIDKGRQPISRFLEKGILDYIDPPKKKARKARKHISIWCGEIDKGEREFIFYHLSPEERREVLLKAARAKNKGWDILEEIING